jgi:hypothetical protein
MDDLNRISFVVKNFGQLMGLLYLPLAMVFLGQILIANQVFTQFPGLLLIYFVICYGLPLLLIGLIYRFYKNSFGSFTSYKSQAFTAKSLQFLSLFILYIMVFLFEFTNKGSGFLFGPFFAFVLVTFPDLKENMIYRKSVFLIAGVILVINFIPINLFFSFKYDFSMAGTKNLLYISLAFFLTGIFNHFLLLRLMRPVRAESLVNQNSQAGLDPIFNNPTNLTILAVLCNCKDADFTFLRKMCQVEETEFYRHLFWLEQAGLIWTHELPNGTLKKVTHASITPTGWQIVNQIYNESRLNRGLLRADSILA